MFYLLPFFLGVINDDDDDDITRATLASAGINCRRVSLRLSVCLSVTSRRSTETAKRWITSLCKFYVNSFA